MIALRHVSAVLLIFFALAGGCGGKAKPEGPAAPRDVRAGAGGAEALARLAAGDVEAAVARLRKAAMERESPLDPQTVAGGYAALVPIPPGEDSVSALLRAGVARLTAGDHAMASGPLLRAIVADKQRAEGYVLQGMSMLERGKNAAALGAFSAALRIDLKNWQARLGKHVAHARLGETTYAATHLRRAVELAPDAPAVLWYEARRLVLDGDRAGASRLLRKFTQGR